MTNMTVADLLQQLGHAMRQRAKAPASSARLFLCAEVVPGMISTDLYQDIGNGLLWTVSGNTISDVVEKLWFAAEVDKRWRGIHVDVIGETFTAEFDYSDGPYPPQYSADEEDDEESGIAEMEAQRERMMAAVRARFGDKPITYPSHEEVSRQAMIDNANYSYDFELEPPSSS